MRGASAAFTKKPPTSAYDSSSATKSSPGNRLHMELMHFNDTLKSIPRGNQECPRGIESENPLFLFIFLFLSLFFFRFSLFHVHDRIYDRGV
jgi:hypothetical protein